MLNRGRHASSSFDDGSTLTVAPLDQHEAWRIEGTRATGGCLLPTASCGLGRVRPHGHRNSMSPRPATHSAHRPMRCDTARRGVRMSCMNRLRTILLLAGVLLVAAAIAGVAQPRLGRSATPSTGTTITVTGNGTVDATPDQASFNFGVTTNGATAAEALSQQLRPGARDHRRAEEGRHRLRPTSRRPRSRSGRRPRATATRSSATRPRTRCRSRPRSASRARSSTRRSAPARTTSTGRTSTRRRSPPSTTRR